MEMSATCSGSQPSNNARVIDCFLAYDQLAAIALPFADCPLPRLVLDCHRIVVAISKK
jgi:hypothetical protein